MIGVCPLGAQVRRVGPGRGAGRMPAPHGKHSAHLVTSGSTRPAGDTEKASLDDPILQALGGRRRDARPAGLRFVTTPSRRTGLTYLSY